MILVLGKRCLVLGVTGFIGSHLAKKLNEEGSFVVGIDKRDIQYPKFFPNIVFLKGDLTDKATWHRIKGFQFDEVFQLAADMGGMGYIDKTSQHDADIMWNSCLINLNCLEHFKEDKKVRVFYSSSACGYPTHNQLDPNNPMCSEDSAYPANPDNEYGWEKLFSERLYKAFENNYGLDVRIARLHNVYGPFGCYSGGREKAPAALCRKVAEASLRCMTRDVKQIEVWGPGIQTRSFMFIEDAICGILKLIRSDVKEILNLGSEELISINDLAELIIDISGNKGKIEIVNIKGPIGVMGRNSDNRLIRKLLNWEPNTKLETGLKITYSWIYGEVEKCHRMQKSR